MAAAREHNRRDASGGWSPHAPYSTTRGMIETCVGEAIRTRKPIAMHVGESEAERELLTSGEGPFADSLRALGVWRSGLFPWGDTPYEWLIDCLGKAPIGLVVHANHLNDTEIERLSSYPHLSVVYCPRTHAFFRHPRHPVAEMLRRGVNVAIGTDSRASNPDLSVWGEVQYLLSHRGDLDPTTVLEMATLRGARSLGANQVRTTGSRGKAWLGDRTDGGFVARTAL